MCLFRVIFAWFQRAVKACPRCGHAVHAEEEPPTLGEDSSTEAGTESSGTTGHGRDGDGKGPEREQTNAEQQKESVRAQIRELEQDLAQTKLQMVEANCKIQVRHTLI